jgi:hypothetical protein
MKNGEKGFRADELKVAGVDKLKNERVAKYWFKRALAGEDDPELKLPGTAHRQPETVSGYFTTSMIFMSIITCAHLRNVAY